jgi:cytochrome c-type protein NapB
METKNRYLLIGLGVLLMLSVIMLFGVIMKQERQPIMKSRVETTSTPSIPLEKGVFTRSSQALDYTKMPFDKNQGRSLDDYYKNRAFNGAPPSIPHDLLDEKGIGGIACLQCHENGGYVDQFNAFAPVTPHPEMLNCKQCHVAQKTSGLFVATDWVRPEPFTINQAAMPGSPPIIPHELQMRENCLACHAGPSAAREIRIDHPERVNCRQCHAAVNQFEHSTDVFSKIPE